MAVARRGELAASAVEQEHVRMTARLLTERSALVAERVAQGRLAIVGAEYALAHGQARILSVEGDLGPYAPDGSP